MTARITTGQTAGQGRGAPRPGDAVRLRAAAFTLLEMVVVIGIIGIVAALALPSLRMNKGNVMSAASRQLLEDMQFARLRAISSRTPVYVVFFTHQGAAWNGAPFGISANTVHSNFFATNPAANAMLGGQFTSYALYTKRSLGDQPGRDSPRYITEWKTLPDGTFFPPAIFTNVATATTNFFNIPIPTPPTETFPVPHSASAIRYALPYLAFDGNGRLRGRDADISISLTLGTVFVFKDATGETNQVTDPDIIENPAGNWTNNFTRVRINWLTGRVKVERPEIP
jgi:prepilin-type N-terminal cleavage/methylation domain-containing protein